MVCWPGLKEYDDEPLGSIKYRTYLEWKNSLCLDITLCCPLSVTAYLEEPLLLGSPEELCSMELLRMVCVRCVSSFQNLSDYAEMDRAPSVSQFSFVLNRSLGTLVFRSHVKNKGLVEWI
jgi:hypothetical protein